MSHHPLTDTQTTSENQPSPASSLQLYTSLCGAKKSRINPGSFRHLCWHWPMPSWWWLCHWVARPLDVLPLLSNDQYIDASQVLFIQCGPGKPKVWTLMFYSIPHQPFNSAHKTTSHTNWRTQYICISSLESFFD